MENEKTILRADIRRTPKNILIIIWCILDAIAFCLGTFGMSGTMDSSEAPVGQDGFITEYYLYFVKFYKHYGKIETRHVWMGGDNYVWREEWVEDEIFNVGFLFLGILITIAGTVLPIIMRKIADNIARQCRLSLTDKSVIGNKKTLFSNKVLNLPIDKIDSIMASHSFLDTLRGGDTLLIRSASGVVKFPWVQNANEFVDATLAKIEEFKQSAKKENQNLISAVAKSVGANSGNSSSAQKIKELKELLDSGLITQEEFEAKRKELLDKM